MRSTDYAAARYRDALRLRWTLILEDPRDRWTVYEALQPLARQHDLSASIDTWLAAALGAVVHGPLSSRRFRAACSALAEALLVADAGGHLASRLCRELASTRDNPTRPLGASEALDRVQELVSRRQRAVEGPPLASAGPRAAPSSHADAVAELSPPPVLLDDRQRRGL